jgi:SecD/SecF fusion protein
MKHNLGFRFTVIAVVIGFLGVMAYLGVAQDRLELGIDLKGGSELIFRFEFEEGTNKKELLTEGISVIQERIDGFGLKDIALQPIGDDRFAVQISAKDKEKVDAVKDLITDLGHLQFRITVEPKASDNHAYYWKLFAEAKAKGVDDETATLIGPADIKPDEKDRFPEGLRWYRIGDEQRGRYPTGRWAQNEAGEPQPWVLCVMDTFNVTGEHLNNVFHAREQGGLGTGWAVYFKVDKLAQGAMSSLTSYEEEKYMAIILNGRVTSAPILQSTLSDSGQITGGFTEKTSRKLAAILQAGALQEAPVLTSERTIAPDLAGSARQTGVTSVGLGFVIVLLLMIWLYRKPGLLANLALLLNLVILLGVLTWFEAVLTLPGIAGVVLTVGMAVDANILVFERIKEERAKGRTVAQSIATGYDRALVTIVDANLTTLITAYFLFQIGSGPVRGFGITLAVGIVASMFTALYVTRSIFELGLRRKWVVEARMRGEWKVPSIPWMSFTRKAAWVSVLAMVLGVFLWEAVPEKARYDLDFTKGSKLIVRFHEEVKVDTVRDRLAALGDTNPIYRDIAVRASAEGIGETVGVDAGTGFELRSQNIATQGQIDDFRERLRTTFQGEILPGPFQATLSVGTVYFVNGDITKGLLEAVLDQYTTETERLSGVEVTALDPVPGAGAVFRLSFKDDVDAAGISLNLRQAFLLFKLGDAVTKYEAAATSEDSTQAEQDEAKRIVAALALFSGQTNETDQFPKVFFQECDPFPLADRIDPSTAEEHRDAAVRAVALSILGIIVYVAFRFRSWYFGFAAVAALIHDVLVVLGAVALVNWLGIVDARLNLVTVAAFLTLIGYSINDSIVVFDRIRENRTSERTRLKDIIDRSINQTLSRTLRTTGTTWIVVAILFVMNFGANSALEGFAFILGLGVLVGTYSSIFIASPTLLFLPWLWERCGATLKGFAKVATPYMVVGAVAILGIAFLRGEFKFEGDFSVPVFNSIALGIPAGLLALFLVNFLRFVRREEPAAEPVRGG